MNNNNTNTTAELASTFAEYSEDEAFIALGRQGLDFVIYCVTAGTVEVMNHTQAFNPKFLQAALGSRYIFQKYSYFDEKKGKFLVNYDDVSRDIEEKCSRVDFEFNSNMIRGAGVHRTNDGEFIINLGRRGVFNTSGQEVPRYYKGNIYIAKGATDFDLNGEAGHQELAVLKEVFSTFNFRSDAHAEVLMGSLINGIVGSAMKNRPIICLEAEAGSGKTTLMRCIRTVLGHSTTRHFESIQNTAQILASIKDGAKAFLFDEFEAKDYSKENLKGLLSLMRASFSANDDSEIIRATGSKKVSYQISCPIFLAAITPPKFEAAVSSRMITLKLAKFCKNKPGTRLDSDHAVNSACKEVSPAIRSFVIKNLVVLEQFAITAHKALANLGYDSRTADKWAPVIAGAMLIEYGLTFSETSAAEKLKSLLPVVASYEDVKRYDEQFAMTSLQAALLHAEFKVGTSKYRLDRLIQGVQTGDVECLTVVKRLESQGIRVLGNSDSSYRLAIASADCFNSVKSVLVRAGVPATDWKNALRKIAGISSDVVVKFSGKAHRAFVLSVQNLFEHGEIAESF